MWNRAVLVLVNHFHFINELILRRVASLGYAFECYSMELTLFWEK